MECIKEFDSSQSHGNMEWAMREAATRLGASSTDWASRPTVVSFSLLAESAIRIAYLRLLGGESLLSR